MAFAKPDSTIKASIELTRAEALSLSRTLNHTRESLVRAIRATKGQRSSTPAEKAAATADYLEHLEVAKAFQAKLGQIFHFGGW